MVFFFFWFFSPLFKCSARCVLTSKKAQQKQIHELEAFSCEIAWPPAAQPRCCFLGFFCPLDKMEHRTQKGLLTFISVDVLFKEADFEKNMVTCGGFLAYFGSLFSV